MKNVILLTIDTFRKDALGLYGNDRGLTPFIDSLQGNSLVLTKAQASGPYTQASFPGILTSSYFLEYGKPKGLSPERTLISEPLKEAGITTGAFHSNPHLCGYFGWNRGWDVFYDTMKEEVDPMVPYIRAHAINEKAGNWLSSHVKGGGTAPFFLWMHYMDIHEPYMPEKRYLDVVDSNLTLSPDQMFALFENVLKKRDVSDPASIQLLKKLYLAHVLEVDNHVEQVFGLLESLNILKDTVIIINSDHGDEFGDHGGLSHDDKMYAELIDVPLVIYGTGESGVCDTLVSNVDIAPTIIHLFGLEPVKAFVGHSLLPLEKFPEKGCFGEAIGEKSKEGGDIDKDVYFYREGDLKIIYRAGLDSWEMYDLKGDPKEQNNIVDTDSRAEEMKAILKPRARRWLNS